MVGRRKGMEDAVKIVAEMEKTSFRDYMDSRERNGADAVHTQQLKFRWKGILEVKQELLRKQAR